MSESQPTTERLLDGVRITRLPITHEDERRALVEFHDSNDVAMRNAKIIYVTASSDEVTVVGGHWEDEVEVFYVTTGVIDELILTDPFTQEVVTHTQLGPSTRIELPPKVAHTLLFSQPATLIAMTENPFSPDKLVPYKPGAA